MSQRQWTDTVQVVGQVPLFAGLTDEDKLQIAALARTRPLPEGTLLWSKGEKPDALVIMVRGKVKVFIANEDGREVTLALLDPPSYLGEVSTFDGSATSASVMAVEDSEALWLRGEDFRALITQSHHLLWELLRVQTSRVRMLSDELASRSFLTTRSRVARKLAQIVDSRGLVEISHQELASLVGSTRESVSRALSELEKQKLVRTGKQQIEVLAPGVLEELGQSG